MNHIKALSLLCGGFLAVLSGVALAQQDKYTRLPSPEGKPYSLTFRSYVPKDIVKRGDWRPPALTRRSDLGLARPRWCARIGGYHAP